MIELALIREFVGPEAYRLAAEREDGRLKAEKEYELRCQYQSALKNYLSGKSYVYAYWPE